MADAVRSGAAPRAVATYMEPESQAAWQTGSTRFIRNWPYAYGLSEDTARLKVKVEVAPLPAYEGVGRASILGPQISQAIYDNVNDAIAGRRTPADAMKRARSQIEQALATF